MDLFGDNNFRYNGYGRIENVSSFWCHHFLWQGLSRLFGCLHGWTILWFCFVSKGAGLVKLVCGRCRNSQGIDQMLKSRWLNIMNAEFALIEYRENRQFVFLEILWFGEWYSIWLWQNEVVPSSVRLNAGTCENNATPCDVRCVA